MNKSEKTNHRKLVKVTIDIYEQDHLLAIALNQLERAKNEKQGYKFKAILPSMSFSVFSVEALCNTFGSQLFSHWSHLESTSLLGKVTIISEFLGLHPDFSKEPWQTINQMKNFRNTLVHAKPQQATETHDVSIFHPDWLLPHPKSKKSIMEKSSIESAEKFYKTASDLQLLWSDNARVAGHEVKVFGVPEYTES